jgi:chemoreceptor zinc-binding protein
VRWEDNYVSAIDYDNAIAAHSAWKRKLTAYLQKPDGSLKVSEVAADNKCVLGQWIYGEGLQWAKLPAYIELRNEHSRFHKVVGDIVNKITAGNKDAASAMLGSKGDYAQTTTRVILAIGALRDATK